MGWGVILVFLSIGDSRQADDTAASAMEGKEGCAGQAGEVVGRGLTVPHPVEAKPLPAT